MATRNGAYNAQSVRHITAGGKEVTAEDEWFENELGLWEQQGVPAELVHLARPLLNGTAAQQAQASKVLNRVAHGGLSEEAADHAVYDLLTKNGIPAPKVPRPSEDDLLAAWDNMSGTGKRNDGNFSFGHSEQTARQARQGISPNR